MKHWYSGLFFLFLWSQAFADSKIITDAEIFEKNNKTKIVTLKGDVNVIFQEQHLLCDEAQIFEKTKTLVAKGNVILKTKESTLVGDRMEFNYETNKGKVFGGVITSGNVLIDGEIIEKIGDDEYVATNAYFTACITCPPSWGFTARKLRAKMGDFAHIYRPWLYILQFPTVPLPFIGLPLNSKRRTGFLFPRLAQSTGGGLGFEVPYFWAIDRSHDATFSGVYYAKRGIQALTNYRFVSDSKSFGELNAGYLNDRSEANEFPEGRDRWFFNYDHFYELPENFVQRTQLRLVGDRFYPRDFPLQSPHFGQAALDNRVSLTKNYEDAHLSIDNSYYISLIENEVRPDNEESLHRFPEINFITSEKQLFNNFPLTFLFESQYLNLGRQGLSYDHLERDAGVCADTNIYRGAACVDNSLSTGEFDYYNPVTQTGDLIRTGQRLDNSATFSAPFWIGNIFDVNPELKFRYTQYALGVQSDKDQGYDSVPSRTYMQVNLATRTYLSRIYANPDRSVKYKHSFIPSVGYQYIPLFQQSSSRFFGTKEYIPIFRANQPLDNGDLDIDNRGRGIQFDFRDRIIGRHLFKFGLINKIYRKEGDPGTGNYTRAFFFDLSQSYDFIEAENGSGRPWQEILGRLAFQYGKLGVYNESSFFPYHGVTDITSSMHYRVNPSSFMSLGYSLKNHIPENPSDRNNDLRSDSLTFGTGLSSSWIDISGTLEYSPKGNKDPSSGISKGAFRRWRILTTLKPPGECWLLKGDFAQALDSDQFNYSISMEFQFGK